MTDREKEVIFLPNEIFQDLIGQDKLQDFTKRAFAYSYYTYISFLYRYCRYVDQNGDYMTQGSIKEFLGYSPISKTVDFIIKKNGILDKMNYTETTTDYPIMWELDEFNDPTFFTLSQMKESLINLPNSIINDRNFKCKLPLTGFHRNGDHSIYDGTFYNIANTHRVDYSIFERIIKDSDLGVRGFYIYGYLKYNANRFHGRFQASYERIQNELNVAFRTLNKYLKRLEELKFITVDHMPFGKDRIGRDREANVYYVLN